MRDALTLTLAIVATAVLSRIATISHAPQIGNLPVIWAGSAVALSCVPGLSFRALFPNGAALQLAAVTWRMMAMLAALGCAGFLEGAARNCYLTSLLACYFVALPLESWLLIRQSRL